MAIERKVKGCSAEKRVKLEEQRSPEAKGKSKMKKNIS